MIAYMIQEYTVDNSLGSVSGLVTMADSLGNMIEDQTFNFNSLDATFIKSQLAGMVYQYDQLNRAAAAAAAAPTTIEGLETGTPVRLEDSGATGTASVSGVVFIDENEDGIRNDVAMLPDVIVQLIHVASDDVIAETTTGPNGTYTLSNVVSGTHKVKFTAPSGYEFSLQDQGSDDTIDSDADTINGETNSFTLEIGEAKTHVDCGMVPLEVGTLRISFFTDTNGNNVKNGGENYSMSGVSNIVLYKDNMYYNMYSAASYPSGVFEEQLPAGNYIVNVVFNQYKTCANPSYPQGAISGLTVVAGETLDVGNFSVAPAGELQLHAFVDTNGNGTQDGGETNGSLPDGTFLRVTPDGGSSVTYGFEIETGSRTVTLLPGDYTVEVLVNGSLYQVTGGANPITGATVIATTTNNLGNRGIAAL